MNFVASCLSPGAEHNSEQPSSHKRISNINVAPERLRFPRHNGIRWWHTPTVGNRTCRVQPAANAPKSPHSDKPAAVASAEIRLTTTAAGCTCVPERRYSGPDPPQIRPTVHPVANTDIRPAPFFCALGRRFFFGYLAASPTSSTSTERRAVHAAEKRKTDRVFVSFGESHAGSVDRVESAHGPQHARLYQTRTRLIRDPFQISSG